MRLLLTDASKVVWFSGTPPPYAILSHTWDDEEVTLDDFQRGTEKSRSGYAKVECACTQAKEDGFKYIWIDTCCIDKSSSVELAEAINSMFQWYRQAEVCYAYLQDVDVDEDPTKKDSSFRSARWFSRGWTLQELLAPPFVQFYGSKWIDIGSRNNLLDIIVAVTGIHSDYFKDGGNLSAYTVAQKMSWASGRTTTRAEDRAYSLLGLFGINMPLLYGEGEKRAFFRLQEEILKLFDDRSVLASVTSHFLASTPTFFGGARLLASLSREDLLSCGYGGIHARRGASVTSHGIEMNLPLVDITKVKSDYLHEEESSTDNRTVYLAILNCGFGGKFAAIVLGESDSGYFEKYDPRRYVRSSKGNNNKQRFSGILMVDPEVARTGEMRTVFLEQSLVKQERMWGRVPLSDQVVLKFPTVTELGFRLVDFSYPDIPQMKAETERPDPSELHYRPAPEGQQNFGVRISFTSSSSCALLALFRDGKEREFHVRLRPTRDAVNATIHANVDAGDVSPGDVADTNPKVLARQETDRGEAVLEVKDRRQSRGWLVLISAKLIPDD